MGGLPPFFGLLAAGIIVLTTLAFEVIEAVRGNETVEAIVVNASGSAAAAVKGELASVN